jgi:hypothetical protein
MEHTMRREWLGLLVISLLLVSAPVEGQCRKRILVFLDVSGSMKPLDRSPASPFQQSLSALQDLLQEPGFIEAEDVLEVVRFGGTVLGEGHSDKGREEASKRLNDLKANKESDQDTNFRAFLDSLARALKDSDRYDSQVVLLGSDLVHEPRNGMPAAEALADWEAVLSEKANLRKEIVSNSSKTTYVFFVPPPASRYSSVQAKVLQDLQKDLQKNEQRFRKVTPGEAVQGGLAHQLLLGLLNPPRLTITRDTQDRNRLAFIVNNPNCVPLRIKELTVERITSEESATGAVRFPVGNEEPALGATGSREATQTFTRPLPTGGDWDSATNLRGTVETTDGLIGSTEGTAGTWLKFKPTHGVLERYLLRSPALRLDLQIQGRTVEPKTFLLSLRGVGQDEATETLAQGKFRAPEAEQVDVMRPSRVRIVLPASRAIIGQIAAQKNFRITIDGADLLEEKQDSVPVLEDPVADWSNLFLIIAGLLSLSPVIYSFFRVKAIGARYPALNPVQSTLTWWMAGIALLPIAANFFHIWLLHHLSPESVDWLAMGVAALAVFATLTFSVRRVQAARFGSRVLSSQPPMDLARYQTLSRRGAWLPWVVGLICTGLFAGIWFYVQPTVSENLAREANPPQLRVVSD